MKRKIVVSLLAVVVAISNASLHAACRQQRVRNVQHHHAAETKFAVPFAVPVAVPVAVVSPYFYGYSQYEDRGARDVGREEANLKSSSLLARHCVTCHGGASPQGQLSLERVEKLSLAERLAAIRAVLSRRMPKGGRLSDEQLYGIVEELSSYE
jgi:mono/diheme cytochrome c family protein